MLLPDEAAWGARATPAPGAGGALGEDGVALGLMGGDGLPVGLHTARAIAGEFPLHPRRSRGAEMRAAEWDAGARVAELVALVQRERHHVGAFRRHRAAAAGVAWAFVLRVDVRPAARGADRFAGAARMGQTFHPDQAV